jgi:hypothetical protein
MALDVPKQSLNIWPPKRRRMRMRSPVALPKMALSTTRGTIITVFDPPMEASGGREIPIRRSDGQRSNARSLGDGACPTHR